MTFDPTIIASYAMADVQPGTWDDTDPESAGGYIADEGDGVPMGLAFVQFSAGAEFDFVWPYDEVSIVTRGSVSIRSGGELLTAREGEVLTQPRGVPGRFEIAEDMEMICVHYPTFARAFGMRVHEHHTIAEGGTDQPEPDVHPRGPEHAGGFYDPTRMQVFRISDLSRWIDVDAEQGSAVAYIADAADGAPFGLAFSDFRRGGVYDLVFAYDEVAAITKGAFTVRSQGREFTAHAGQLLYMPKDVSAVFEIEQDTITVGVHYPTYQEAYGVPPQGVDS
ncbi:MAG TPA: hypothetical protein VK095_14785 [Beutenbergiaceae bacterium]|nr:hypothetical protein [Beutenbergiaceae bacterium]